MGEGSGVLVLEELETARARGARIYAEMVGYGASGDAYHITGQPADANGAIRSMQAALRSAQMQPTDIDYINAHGTSTELNDRNETLAIKAVLGDHAYKTPISSTKSMTGHLLGAAGAVEAIACALTLRDGIIHPTMNYETPDPQCDLDYVPNQPRKADVRVTMSNSFWLRRPQTPRLSSSDTRSSAAAGSQDESKINSGPPSSMKVRPLFYQEVHQDGVRCRGHSRQPLMRADDLPYLHRRAARRRAGRDFAVCYRLT